MSDTHSTCDNSSHIYLQPQHVFFLSGVTSPPLALWDVDGDGLEDVLIGVTNISNDSQPMNAQSKGERKK